MRVKIVASVIALFGAVSYSAFFYNWVSSFLLLLLSLVGFFSYGWAGAFAFCLVSFDEVVPTFAELYIAHSEVSLLCCLVLLFFWWARGSRLEWRPIFWGGFLAFSIALSGLVNIPYFKILPHVVRSCELVLGVFIGLNAVNIWCCEAGGVSQTERSSAVQVKPRLANSLRNPFSLAIVSAATLYTIHGLSEYFLEGQIRIASVFQNANLYAGYLAVLCPLVFVLFCSCSRRVFRLALFYLLAICLAALLLTLSRTGILSGVIGLVVVWLLYYRSYFGKFLADPFDSAWRFARRSGPIVGIHLVLLIVLILFLSTETGLNHRLDESLANLEVRFRQDYSTRVLESRQPYWHLGWEIWKDHPLFGIGPGRFPERVDDYASLISAYEQKVRNRDVLRKLIRLQVHSGFLQVMVDFGLLGLAGIMAFLAWITCSLWRNRSSYWAVGGLGSLAAFLVGSTFDISLLAIPIETGLLIGFVIGLSRIDPVS